MNYIFVCVCTHFSHQLWCLAAVGALNITPRNSKSQAGQDFILVVTFFPRSFALVQLKAKMTFDAAERGLSPASHHNILQLGALLMAICASVV